MTTNNNDRDNPVITTFLTIEKSLKTYLMRFLVRPQDIEDAVQETFVRAYEAQKTGEIRSPRSFLYKVAKNLALSEITRKTNKMMVTIGDLEELDVLVGSLSMEEGLDVAKDMASLSLVIGELPPKCQSVIIMRKVYGFSHKEIALRMGISVKTVEKHLTKALQRCQDIVLSQDAKIPAERGKAAGNSQGWQR